MNKNTLRAILVHIFSAVLAVCIFYTVLIGAVNVTVKNSGTIDDGFFNALADELVTELKAYAPSTGVDEAFFEDSFDKTRFVSDTRAFVTACFDGALRPDVRADIKTEFYNKLCEYADDEGYMLTDDITSALSNLADICADKYVSYSSGSIMAVLFSYLAKLERTFDRYALILYTALALIIAVCVWGILRITDRRKLFLRGTVVLTASALMCGAAPLFVLLGKFTDRIGITSYAVKGYLTGLANGVLHGCLVFAVILAVLAITVFMLGALKNHEKAKH